MDTIIPSDATPLKQCSTCKEWKPATLEYFRARNNRPCGWDSRCKSCHKVEYTLKHPPKPKEQLPTGHKRCTSCLTVFPATSEYFYHSAKYGLIWECKKCGIERACAYTRARRKSPPVDIPVVPGLRYCWGCHEMKPATLEFFRKESRRPAGLDTRCKVCRCEMRKRYFRENAEQRTRNATRSRRYKDIPGTLTTEQIRDKLQKQHYHCYYCFDKFEKRNGEYVFHLEHTVPVSRTEYNPRHDINFVVLACHTCNESKRNKLPHEWPRGGRLM